MVVLLQLHDVVNMASKKNTGGSNYPRFVDSLHQNQKNFCNFFVSGRSMHLLVSHGPLLSSTSSKHNNVIITYTIKIIILHTNLLIYYNTISYKFLLANKLSGLTMLL